MEYKKYFRKTSLKQEGIGEHFLNEIASKKPKNFLEIGVFHGVTARNVCELLYSIHGNDFKYVGLDLFGENTENANEVIPNTKFNNPLKRIYFEYILRQDPYSVDAVTYLLKKFEKIYDIVEKEMIKEKNIYPNVDYPTGPTYHLMGFDTDFFTPIFVISRITGWSAHIMEQHAANKLIRPLASYKGSKHRKVMQLNQR